MTNDRDIFLSRKAGILLSVQCKCKWCRLLNSRVQANLDLLTWSLNIGYVQHLNDLLLIVLLHKMHLLWTWRLCWCVASKSTRRCRRASGSQHSCRCDWVAIRCHIRLWRHIDNSGRHAEHLKDSLSIFSLQIIAVPLQLGISEKCQWVCEFEGTE